MSDKEKLEAGTSASASFASLFDFKTSTKLGTDQKMVEAYNSKVASSFILSYGGPSLKASDMNLTEWERNLANHLVAVDRRGRPIYDLITPRALPELSESLTFRLAAAVKAAVVRYYEANSLIGCLDPASTAYDSDANVAADNCDDFPYQDQTTDVQGGQLPLGGVYTTCKGPSDLCSRHIAPNLATGNTSCPRGFMPVGLLPPQVRSCAVACQDRKVFQEPLCVHECAVTRAFWCALDPSTETDGKNELGFLFGGIYTDTTMNPITKAQSCPPYYEVQSVGRRIQLCLSTDFEMGRRYSLAFGGFYTCQSGNPLYDVLSLNSSSLKRVQQVRRGLHAGLKIGHSDYNGSTSGEDPGIIWSKRCPNGYTSHMAAIEDTCLINCCIPGNSLKVVKERTLKRPPFVQLPDFASIETPLDLQKSLNQPLRLVDTYSGRTYHNQEGEWVPDEAAAEPVNTSASAFLIFAVVMLVILFVVVMGFIIHYAYRRVACSRQQGPFNPTEDSTA